MKPIEHILVPTDFSEASSSALDMATSLAEVNRAKVTLVHVFDPQSLGPRGGRPNDATEQMTLEVKVEKRILDELERWAADMLAKLEKVATKLVIHRSAAQGICDFAREAGADLIVIATHGRTGLAGVLIGSVAEKVVRHAPCPVLTVRSTSSESRSAP